MTGSSDEERYSRFRGEHQGLTVVVVVADNDRSCTQDQRSRPRQRENLDGSRGHRGALAERRRQERREQRE